MSGPIPTPNLEFRLHSGGPDGCVWKLWTESQMVRFGPPGAPNAEVQLEELRGLAPGDEALAGILVLRHFISTLQLNEVLVRAAIARDAQERSAALHMDGETVHAPDDDLGFTVPLSEWRRLGGRELAAHASDPLTLTPTRSVS